MLLEYILHKNVLKTWQFNWKKTNQRKRKIKILKAIEIFKILVMF